MIILVKELETVFGVPTVVLNNLVKKRGRGILLSIFLDIIVIIIATFRIATTQGMIRSEAPIYITVCIIDALIVNLLVSNLVKKEYKGAYLFYKRYRNYKTSTFKASLDTDKFFSVLFCAGYLRLKSDKTLDYYVDALQTACCQNIKFSKRIMKRLKNYKDDNGNFEFITIQKGRHLYIVDIKKEGSSYVSDN